MGGIGECIGAIRRGGETSSPLRPFTFHKSAWNGARIVRCRHASRVCRSSRACLSCRGQLSLWLLIQVSRYPQPAPFLRCRLSPYCAAD